MGGCGSGGANAIDISEHLARGTFRPARHAGRVDPAPAAPVSTADRRRTLHGLSPAARRMAIALIDDYSGWHSATLFVLRQFVECCARLERISGDAERRREQRAALALLKCLELEK